MKVFLTGATGYIGSVVAEKLIAAGHDVLGLARSEESAEKLRGRGVTPYRGDLNDPEGITRVAADSDGVIHTASTGNPKAAQADRQTVEAVLSVLEGTSKPFVYTSGVWVMGNTGERVADEESPLDPTPLVAWRPAIERLVLEAAKRHVRTAVIRPTVVYGRRGGIVGRMVDSARVDGVARFVGSGENHWSLVHVDDLADLYGRALEQAPAGTLLLAASGKALQVREIAKAVSRAAGISGRIQSWPLEQARQQLGPYADALVLDQQISGAKAARLLGWSPQALSTQGRVGK